MDNSLVKTASNSKVGFWNKKKTKLKQMFPFIADEDLNFYEGKEYEMIEMLSYKVGKSVDELRSIINNL
ncbi:MAG: general stress protein CsbD [Bacteroidetes bacterium HGW-Bacteroidetes-12]|nr:MAG: general stress protein CsbD [Bacteroidetes bacterium HGW-Bacteroidetes-12]